ncbi:MAG: aldehyde dehydrogenase family protein [Streptosporangiaceae bacterium]
MYYEFTVADRVPLDSLFATEESFGPVVPVITADSEEELLSIANSDPLGLQAAVFTQNISKACRFVEELAVGQVVVNDSTCCGTSTCRSAAPAAVAPAGAGSAENTRYSA